MGAGEADELHLISHQPAGRLHSQLESAASSMQNKHGGREQVRLHPSDAEARRVSDGQTVRLWNTRGSCLAVARLNTDTAQGVAVLPTGAWFTPAQDGGPELSGNPNVLTRDIGTSAFGQGCAAHTCLVRVEAYAGDNRNPMESYREGLAAMIPK